MNAAARIDVPKTGTPPRASCRELGSGPRVLCVHPSSSSSAQWRPLMERLASKFRVLAVDIYGHGKSVPWPGQRDLTLDDEASFIEPLLPAGEPLHLVGHSYGGAIAVKIARRNPARVASVVLYEPALWGSLAATRPHDPATREIEAVRTDTNRLIDAGDLEAAAERFVDYWGGAKAWASTPAPRRAPLVESMHALRFGWAAAFADCPQIAELAALETPWLLLTGSRSALPAQRVTELLRMGLPRAELIEFEGLGHLAPITHAEVVNEAIAAFLEGLTAPILDTARAV